MFVKVSCICGKQIRVLAVKKANNKKKQALTFYFYLWIQHGVD